MRKILSRLVVAVSAVFLGIAAVWFYFAVVKPVSSQNPPLVMRHIEPKSVHPSVDEITKNPQLFIDALLEEFVQAQRNGDWNRVSEIIGGNKYTGKQKQCLIEQMKRFPMVGQTHGKAGFSTELFSLPKEKYWWTISVKGEFKTPSGLQTISFQMRPHLDNGILYLTPPNLDDFEREKIIKETASLDLNQFFEVVEQPDCPLEVVQVEVKQSGKNLSERIVILKLRNKTAKKIISFSYDLDDGISAGLSRQIKPGQIITIKESDTGFAYYCQGERKRRFYIAGVSFADGSEWESKLEDLED